MEKIESGKTMKRNIVFFLSILVSLIFIGFQSTVHAAENQSTNEISQVDHSGWIQVKAPAHIPILMYHSISKGNSLRLPEKKFRAQMEWLKDHGYYTLSAKEAYLVLTRDIKPAKKVVWLTFDDGYSDNYEKAYPILKKYGMKATISVIGRSYGKENHMGKRQLSELHSNGFSIASHTIHHLDLDTMSANAQYKEMIDSKKWLDRLFHQNTILLCYPAGRYNSNTIAMAKKAGYLMAITTEPGSASRTEGLYSLHRIRITPGMSLEGFGRIVQQANE